MRLIPKAAITVAAILMASAADAAEYLPSNSTLAASYGGTAAYGGKALSYSSEVRTNGLTAASPFTSLTMTGTVASPFFVHMNDLGRLLSYEELFGNGTIGVRVLAHLDSQASSASQTQAQLMDLSWGTALVTMQTSRSGSNAGTVTIVLSDLEPALMTDSRPRYLEHGHPDAPPNAFQLLHDFDFATVVPEPAGAMLLLSALSAFLAARRMRAVTRETLLGGRL